MLNAMEREVRMPRATQPRNFMPDHDNARIFRSALGRFSTGITVITINTPDGPMGFTANSFSSVSLDPPMVLWSLARSSNRFAPFATAKDYTIHVLSADQVDLCKRFARSGAGFEGIEVSYNEAGVPLIENCLARFECQQYASYDGGDHVIIVGRVEEACMRNGEPLLFSSGEYGRFREGAL
jgi:flavin reductase (DIM6/NTAB) family NADH-FMN oxidoreductase RutF